MAKFSYAELVGDWEVRSAKLGSNTVANGGDLVDADVGKFVALVGESRYGLAATGGDIEGWLVAVEVASADGYAFGACAEPDGFKTVTCDGLQATPGTGTIAIGDFVCVGTVVAAKTAIGGYARVCKSTDQVAAKNSAFAARVVSLQGGGVVGTLAVIECLG